MWVLVLCVLFLLVVGLNVLLWPRVGPSHTGEAPCSVAVLVPMRNEEAHIAECLEAIRKADAGISEIMVYEDHSTDRGPALVREAARNDPRIRLLDPEPLPDGWCGKPFACAQLAAAAKAEWLLFIDADARLLPGAPGRMVTEARRRGVTFLSCWPGLDMHGAAEQVFLPMLNFVVLTLFPTFVSLKRMTPSLGLAHGACLLMERNAYRRTGGHETVRTELFEDTALARAWRAAGEQGVCLDGQDIVRVRMYEGFLPMWRGFTKNAYPAFRREVSFWLFVMLHLAVFTAPFAAVPWLALRGGGWPAWAGAAACTLVMRLMLAIRFRHPLWSLFFHPAASLVMCCVMFFSWYRCRTGAGVAWKGRTYRAGPQATKP